MSEIIIIAAVAKNNAIGKDGKMPWGLEFKEDLERFKKLTLNHTIIMGRKTFESLPIKPLPKRKNLVITKSLIENDKIKTFPSLNTAIKCAKESGDEKIFLIGGESVYTEGLNYADTLEITSIKKEYDADTFFPKIDKTKWEKINSEEKEEYSFDTYKRIK